MLNIEELKQYARLHVRTHSFTNIDPLDIINNIHLPPSEVPTKGAWDQQWVIAAEKCLKEGAMEDAIQCFNFARFPYPHTEQQKAASKELSVVFERTYAKDNIRKQTFNMNGKPFCVYTSNLHLHQPCLLVIGGIVSVKEQWKVFLKVGKKLGFSVIIMECPGVGENRTVYNTTSHRMLGQVLDELSPVANVNQTYIVGMSFGGHLAIKQALEDTRVKGITTVGAPLHYFFKDFSEIHVPFITQLTLSHVMEKNLEDVSPTLTSYAISPEELRDLHIPLTYIFSGRDEIIPTNDKEFLLENGQNMTFYEFDDVHGSPNHLDLIQKIVPLSMLKQSSSKKIAIRLGLALILFLTKWKKGWGKQ
ncbi:alpha/beta hydrolase [Salipaludibacillus agaradhaerens]|uniref:alpha/beta hydrolase n=1 Tax=Salipaludibacillus agaradhaerens TaxID=76935 RepID=UPI0021516B4D|nr:esterase FrsA [Salipaludibacillus agaradhaerens]MCR6108468.1 alpha/beta hydrolase [Salipaludibacillus agaradhaerens]MCR6120489.1 alpha/beta hydrolase [Salipaludibacillus agaradhaerens]